MARNTTGTYSLPTSPFIAGSAIVVTPVNANFNDIATGLTQSIATDGKTLITGALRAATGTVVSPSITFVDNLTDGLYLISAGNVGVAANSQLVFDLTLL